MNTSFDTLDYFEKLKNAGVPESQAKAQVEVMQGILKNYDGESRKELATKGDIQDVRNEIQDVRNEIQDVRNELKDVRVEIANTKHEILKWMVTAMLAQTALLVGIIAFLK